jgi:hypothetical protein
MARARFSAYKSSITNRGPESGGSVGGNNKPGLINLWQWSQVPTSQLAPRLPNACCKDPNALPPALSGSISASYTA